MSTNKNYSKNLDRTYFNVYRPVQRVFDDSFYNHNKRGPIEEQSEINRQTGSGYGVKDMRKLPIYNIGARTTNPPPFYGSGKMHGGRESFNAIDKSSIPNPAINNWLPSRIPEPRLYQYNPMLEIHSAPSSPIIYPIKGPKDQGRLSNDDGKKNITKYYNYAQFRKPTQNPLNTPKFA